MKNILLIVLLLTFENSFSQVLDCFGIFGPIYDQDIAKCYNNFNQDKKDCENEFSSKVFKELCFVFIDAHKLACVTLAATKFDDNINSCCVTNCVNQNTACKTRAEQLFTSAKEKCQGWSTTAWFNTCMANANADHKAYLEVCANRQHNCIVDCLNIPPERINEDASLLEESSIIRLYPNPTNGPLNLEYSSIASESIFITIYDFQGRTLLYQPMDVSKGTSIINLDCHEFGSGIYILETKNSSASHRMKFMVDR